MHINYRLATTSGWDRVEQQKEPKKDNPPLKALYDEGRSAWHIAISCTTRFSMSYRPYGAIVLSKPSVFSSPAKG